MCYFFVLILGNMYFLFVFCFCLVLLRLQRLVQKKRTFLNKGVIQPHFKYDIRRIYVLKKNWWKKEKKYI